MGPGPALFLRRQPIGQADNKHHSQRFHHQAWTEKQNVVAGLRLPESPITAAESLDESLLAVVEQYISNAAQTFIDRLHPAAVKALQCIAVCGERLASQ